MQGKMIVAASAALFSLVTTAASATEPLPDGFGVSVGKAVLTGEMTSAAMSFRYRRWEAGAFIFGYGNTDDGPQERLAYAASVSRLFRPDWQFCRASLYGRVGVAYVDGSPLVGHFNFRTGVGVDFGGFAFELMHYSSASLTPLNTGINLLEFRVPF
ncbi:acyloxyacyl hydrolase [Microbulbifer yueqingensis]|uniref:Lipid A 3-O-deacylase (PagL) n=1 Tax=Microbulbifer yueqingensis TaxID=658219 RepID=A0A1G8X729_9GAMM|nr:acyloxyacyl hydrolase [Microbulbifer yueqingensis]SDJ86271.1 Lipid A 3-O-deacylase (PagL) [Microbulbifer yueqingensis]